MIPETGFFVDNEVLIKINIKKHGEENNSDQVETILTV